MLVLVLLTLLRSHAMATYVEKEALITGCSTYRFLPFSSSFALPGGGKETRSTHWKQARQIQAGNKDANFLTARVNNYWDDLPKVLVDSTSMAILKSRLDFFFPISS